MANEESINIFDGSQSRSVIADQVTSSFFFSLYLIDWLIDCKKVVVSVPIGVLKRNLITFLPPLSSQRKVKLNLKYLFLYLFSNIISIVQNAIENIQMGCENKAILVFQRRHWPLTS